MLRTEADLKNKIYQILSELTEMNILSDKIEESVETLEVEIFYNKLAGVQRELTSIKHSLKSRVCNK